MNGIPAQSRPASFAEALANVIAGYVVAVVVQAIVYPLFGIETSLATDGIIALLFTATSLLRAYGLRRLFLRIEHHRSTQERLGSPAWSAAFRPAGHNRQEKP